MPQKKRLSDDAFSWVKKTDESEGSTQPAKKKSVAKSKKTKEPVAESTALSEKSKSPVSSKGYSNRTVFVQYHTDGTIISVVQMSKPGLPGRKSPFTDRDNLKSAELKIPLQFENEHILEIHKRCKVMITNGEPRLEIAKL